MCLGEDDLASDVPLSNTISVLKLSDVIRLFFSVLVFPVMSVAHILGIMSAAHILGMCFLGSS